MAQNYIGIGVILTLEAECSYLSGKPYRINGFNGVALHDVGRKGEQLSFQIVGIFEFPLNGIVAGDLIYLDRKGLLTKVNPIYHGSIPWAYGRAVTKTDKDGRFHCLILQP